MRKVCLSTALALLSACAPATSTTTSTSTSSSSSGTGGPQCTAGTVSPLRFERRTEDYGLAALGVKGNRIAVADLDEDGYPDLVIHKVYTHARTDFTAEVSTWRYRVLMNRPKDGGGRHFVDMTEESGLFALRNGPQRTGRNSQLAIFADFNNDGHLDAFSGTYVDPTHPETDPGDRSEILLGDGQGHFVLSTALPAPMQDVQTVSAATTTDYDLDGKADVFIGNWYERYGYSYLGMQDRLLIGVGDGTFYDGTNGAQLRTSTSGFDEGTNHRPTYGVTACDLNGDMEQELLVSAYGRQLNQLWLHGNFVYSDVGIASGFASDENEDFTDNENYKCHCQNTGSCQAAQPRIGCPSGPSWTSEIDEAPWRLGGNTFTTLCADFTGDGLMDLFNVEIRHWWAGENSDFSNLLVQTDPVGGEPRFIRQDRDALGLSVPHPTVDWNEGGLMGAAGDLDHDGRLDLIVAYSDYPDQFGLLYHQKDDGTYEEVGEAAGFHHPCLSGLALLDVDRDGDLDIVAGSSTARDCAALWPNGNEVHLYENTSGQDANEVQLQLVGAGAGGANKSAIGARITAQVDGRTLVREVQGGHGHAGMQHEMTVDLGLGAACQADVTVRWPNSAKSEQTFTGLQHGKRYRIVEGAAEPVEVP